MKFYLKHILAVLLIALVAPQLPAKTVALALSGGGARGFATIGVLKALEEEHLQPDLIVGTSMGAVIGGLYAAGYSASELEHMALRTDWSNIFLARPSRRSLFLGKKETISRHILSLRFRGWVPEVPVALSNGQQLTELLFDLVHRAPYQPWSSFDDLEIRFRAVACDLRSGKPVIFRQGDLTEAMRASISLPLVFAPYVLDSLVLVDGGVVENIPVEIAHDEGADAVIALDMSSDLVTDENLALPWELANRVTTVMQSERNKDSRDLADLVIAPDCGNHSSTNFENIAALIDSGYRATRARMPQLKALLAKSDTVLAAKSSSFCSREVYRKFRTDVSPKDLPPLGYRFYGVHYLPDSLVSALPNGYDGLRKLELVRQSYMDLGRTQAHAIELQFTPERTLMSHWQEGRIRSIHVHGLQRYRPSSVLREFPLEAGEFFDLRRAQRGISQIYGSDLYETVTLSAVPSDSGTRLTLRVEERQSPQLRVGVGFSLERRGRGFIEFLNDNILNIGARLSVFGKYGERDEVLRAAVTFDRMPISTPIDRALQSTLTTDLRVGWQREEYSFYSKNHRAIAGYHFERTGAEGWVGRAFRRWGELSGGVRYEQVHSMGVPDESEAHVTYVGVRTIVDTKDSYPFPTRGFAWNGRYEYALKSQQTGRAFNRLLADAEAYLPLLPRLVAAGRTSWGWNDRLLPLWGQFQLGGPESLLGLHVAERLGSSKLSFGTELRYDLVSQWLADAYVSGLYTLGAVSEASDPLPRGADYQHGIGLRLSLATFLGPMRFTAAELLPSHLGGEHIQFYLNLGHEF